MRGMSCQFHTMSDNGPGSCFTPSWTIFMVKQNIMSCPGAQWESYFLLWQCILASYHFHNKLRNWQDFVFHYFCDYSPYSNTTGQKIVVWGTYNICTWVLTFFTSTYWLFKYCILYWLIVLTLVLTFPKSTEYLLTFAKKSVAITSVDNEYHAEIVLRLLPIVIPDLAESKDLKEKWRFSPIFFKFAFSWLFKVWIMNMKQKLCCVRIQGFQGNWRCLPIFLKFDSGRLFEA